MIEVELTQAMVDEARTRAENLGELKNSLTRGKGNIIGFLGEMAALQVLGGKSESTPDYDIVMPDGTKIDVKTKRCRSEPQPHFDCSVSGLNTTQKCDKYVFVRILNDFSKAWVLGELPKQEFYDKAVFYEQGQFDPRTKWRCLYDCYNVQIAELNEITAA